MIILITRNVGIILVAKKNIAFHIFLVPHALAGGVIYLQTAKQTGGNWERMSFLALSNPPIDLPNPVFFLLKVGFYFYGK